MRRRGGSEEWTDRITHPVQTCVDGRRDSDVIHSLAVAGRSYTVPVSLQMKNHDPVIPSGAEEGVA